MVTFLSTRETQFHYFDHILSSPDWKNRTVLDFGGNIGGFLAGAGGRVQDRHIGVSISRKST